MKKADPLREALHAAALATMTAAERDNSDRFHNGQPGPGHIRRAAETVAAFLRAFPVHHMRRQMGPGRYDPDGTTTRTLAAALRAMAEEANDG